MNFLQTLSDVKSACSYAYAVYDCVAPLVHDTKHLCHFVFKDEMKTSGAKTYATSIFPNAKCSLAKLVADLLNKKLAQEQSFVLTTPDMEGKRHVLGVAQNDPDPLKLLYEALSTICGIMQAVKLYPEYFENLETKFWKRRETGESAEKIEQSFKTNLFNYEKVKNIIAAYKDLQTHAAASVYMCVAARANVKCFADVSNFCLRLAAQDSKNLPQKGAGALAFGVVSKLISQIDQGGTNAYLDTRGMPDWNKIFEYTLVAVKNCGYTPHQIMDASKQEGAFIAALSAQYLKTSEKLSILKWCAEYKTSRILQDYALAQDFLLHK